MSSSLLVTSYHPDNIHAVTLGKGLKTIFVVNTETGKVVQKLTFPQQILSVSVSHDGHYLLTAMTGLVQLWNMHDYSVIHHWENTDELEAQKNNTTLYRYGLCSKTTDRIVLGNVRGELQLWAINPIKLLRHYSTPQWAICSHIAISPDDRKIASVYFTHNYFTIWDVDTGQSQLSDYRLYPLGIDSLVFSPDSTHLLISKRDLLEWDIRDILGRPVRRFSLGNMSLYNAIYSPDGKMICSYNNKEQIILFDRISGMPVQQFSGHTDKIISLSFSPDGTRLLSYSNAGITRIWDVTTGVEVRRFQFD